MDTLGILVPIGFHLIDLMAHLNGIPNIAKVQWTVKKKAY
jgi:hypothetical protein